MTALVLSNVVNKVHDLPSLPAIIMALLSGMGQENIDIGSLADTASRDPALAAKILRLANSPFYGMQRRVTTMQQAIAILGFRSVRTLITATALAASFPAHGHGAFDFQAFWRHAIATAVCARALARHLDVNVEFAFMAGLLHDLGRLVLVTRYPQEYAAAVAYRATRDCYMLDAEREVLGVDHIMVGCALAGHWKFPETIQQAIAGHHAPEQPGMDTLAAVVHIADAIAHALDLAGAEDDLVPPVSAVAWDGLGMDDAAFMQVLRETEREFEAICQILLK